MRSAHRLTFLSALLILSLLLCTPWSAQAGAAGTPGAEGPAGLYRLLDWLAGLLGEAGCTFDPSGVCRDSTDSELATGSDGLEAGCIFDPSGRGCDRAANLDNGCSFDPSGRGCRGDQ